MTLALDTATNDSKKFYENSDGTTSVKVVGASGLPIAVVKTTNTATNVVASATSVTLLAANTLRVGVVIYNDSSSNLYVKWGASASTTSFSYLIAGGATWECPANMVDGSQLSGIWDVATGTARITEAVQA